MRIQQEEGLSRGLVFVVVRNGQVELAEPTSRFQQLAVYDGGVVAALRPVSNSPTVQIDPQRSFGMPIVHGIRTSTLAEEYRAGVTTVELADLYDLSAAEVEDAIRYELTSLDEHVA